MTLEKWNSNLSLLKIEECGEEPLGDRIQPILAWKRRQNDVDDDNEVWKINLPAL